MAKKTRVTKKPGGRAVGRATPATRRAPAARAHPAGAKGAGAKKPAAAARQVIDPGWSWDDDFPLSQGVRIGDFLYLSGQIPVDDDGNLVGRGDLRAQTRQTFENIKTVLDQAGASFADIVKMNTYFTTDIHDYEEYFAVRREYLGDNKPASTGVQVAALAFEGLMLEVEAIAYLAARRR